MFNYSNEVVASDMKIIVENNKYLEKLKNKNILITGATGMIATYCCYLLCFLNEYFNYNIKIVALARNEEKAKVKFDGICDKPFFTLLIQDITQPLKIKNEFDYILNMAGSASAYAIVHNPEDIIMANVLGTKNVLDFAIKNDKCRVLYTSTREVYGKLDNKIDCISEDMHGILDFSKPRSCYPESKRTAENLLSVYSQKYNLDFVNVRIAHTYGPGMALENDGRVMADLLNYAVKKEDIVLNSDGMMKRAFCYLSDGVSAIFMVLLNGITRNSYNIANETEEISVRDLAKLIAKKSYSNISVKYKEITEMERQGYLNIERIRLNTFKIEQLGWKPLVSLEEGIFKTIRSLGE